MHPQGNQFTHASIATNLGMTKWIGLGAIAASLVIMFIWIPLDVESGLIEKVRRSVNLGDAFAPTVAGALIGLGGLFCLLSRDHRPSDSTSHQQAIQNDNVAGSDVHSAAKEHLAHAAMLLIVFIIGLTIMRYAGPLAVSLLRENNTEYRLLRDTVPWKYVGFVLGGTTLIAVLIAWTERKLRLRHVAIGLLATLALIAVYDLPFDDLLLQPNGDV